VAYSRLRVLNPVTKSNIEKNTKFRLPEVLLNKHFSWSWRLRDYCWRIHLPSELVLTLASSCSALLTPYVIIISSSIIKTSYLTMVSRDSSVGTATGWTAGVRFPARLRFFSSPQRPDRLWSPPILLSNGRRGLFSRGKAAGAWSWLTSKCRGQEWWSYTSTPPYDSMVRCLIN
jgi:hypothetical protein